MKLYIVGAEHGEDGCYMLVTEHGQCIASHICSHAGFARKDLIDDNPQRQEQLNARFGSYQVINLGSDTMTREELLQRNQSFADELQRKRLMSIREVINEHLDMVGADGLVNHDLECGCGKDDIPLCECVELSECRPAKKCWCVDKATGVECSEIKSCWLHDDGSSYCYRNINAISGDNKT